MNLSNIDPETGIPEDVLTLLVYTFFPTSERHFSFNLGYYEINAPYIFKSEDGTEHIFTGSSTEYLCLPAIIDMKKENDSSNYPWPDKSVFIWPDRDEMINAGIAKDIYHTMRLEMDKDRPVYCRIRETRDLHSPYYSSAIVVKSFRSQLSNTIYIDSSECNLPKFKEGDGTSAFSTSFLGKNSEIRHYHYDKICCVPVKCPKDIKKTFSARLDKSKWPLNAVRHLNKLLTKRMYVIPKIHKNSEMGHLRWRLSFSVIEVELARSLTEIQRRCYRVLKALIKFDVNKGLPEGTDKYPSYYLKTTMFWLMENTPKDSWKIRNLGRQWLTLLDKVIESLEKRNLPHYFVPSYNLLCDKPPSAINCWKERLKQIRKKPLKAFTKFTSKYELHDNQEPWRGRSRSDLNELDKILSPIADIKANTDTGKFDDMYLKLARLEELVKHYVEILKEAIWLKMTCTYNLLFTYSLGDFLQLHKVIPVDPSFQLHAQSDEHLIWNNYQFLFTKLSRELGDTRIRILYDYYCRFWSFSAELIHHMFLKYKDQVPHKDLCLFSTQTAERFHLIACACFSSTEVEYFSHQYMRYMNYLRVQKQYEDSVRMSILHCTRYPYAGYCYFSRHTSEVLDISIRLQMAMQDESCFSPAFLSFHFLTCCYMEAGVLAEICFPEGNENPLGGSIFVRPEDLHADEECMHSAQNGTGKKKILLGYQFLLSGDLKLAYHCFASVTEDEILHENRLPFGIKNTAMLYLTARLISRYFGSST